MVGISDDSLIFDRSGMAPFDGTILTLTAPWKRPAAISGLHRHEPGSSLRPFVDSSSGKLEYPVLVSSDRALSERVPKCAGLPEAIAARGRPAHQHSGLRISPGKLRLESRAQFSTRDVEHVARTRIKSTRTETGRTVCA